MSSIKQSPLDSQSYRELKSSTLLDNSLYFLGRNSNGEFGLSNITAYTTLTSSPVVDIVEVYGSQAAYYLNSNGQLFCSGYNTYGELAQGDIIYRSSPVQIPGTWDSFINPNGNQYHGASAFKSDRTLWTWGYNGHGQLGQNDVAPRSSPVQLAFANVYSKVGSGYYTTLFVKPNGTLWGVGYGAHGDLAQITEVAPRSSPIQIGSDTDWLDVAAGHGCYFGLKTNGTLFAWGQNSYGDLGIIDAVPRSSPVQIPGTWANISAHIHGGSARNLSNNRVYVWGYNGSGMMGKNDVAQRSSPVLLGTDGNYKYSLSTYNYCRYMIDYDDNLWGCGANTNYELGTGDTAPRSTPIQITTNGSVSDYAAGSTGAVILQANNNLLGTGYSRNNLSQDFQLGNL